MPIFGTGANLSVLKRVAILKALFCHLLPDKLRQTKSPEVMKPSSVWNKNYWVESSLTFSFVGWIVVEMNSSPKMSHLPSASSDIPATSPPLFTPDLKKLSKSEKTRVMTIRNSWISGKVFLLGNCGWVQSERDKMWSRLAAHICHFFRLTARNPVFRDKKCRILMFCDKKCRILTFRDKTELYSTVLRQNMQDVRSGQPLFCNQPPRGPESEPEIARVSQRESEWARES